MNSPPFSYQLQGNRERQEDAVLTLADDRRVVLAVADGLGGHGSGDVASKLLLEILNEELANLHPIADAKTQIKSLCERVVERFQSAVAAHHSAQNPHTTVALAIIEGNKLFTAHVGDSRVYHISGGDVWRTRDHSVVQLLVDDGEIKEYEMATHPEQGKLYQSIGPLKQPRAGITQRALKTGDLILACSDGFWEGVTPNDLAALARNYHTDDVLRLARQSMQKYAPKSDNVTVASYLFMGGRRLESYQSP